jgi:hypothetical protein
MYRGVEVGGAEKFHTATLRKKKDTMTMLCADWSVQCTRGTLQENTNSHYNY